MDIAALRERLSATSGKRTWRCLEDLADDPQFEALLARQFPGQATWASTGRRAAARPRPTAGQARRRPAFAHRHNHVADAGRADSRSSDLLSRSPLASVRAGVERVGPAGCAAGVWPRDVAHLPLRSSR